MNKLRDKWNSEFVAGKWDFLRGNNEQVRLKRVAHLIHGNLAGEALPLIDLGSGEGHLCNWLDEGSINQYVAVDISNVALENIAEDKIPVTRICESLATYSPDAELKSVPLVIVANEVLYYEADSVEQLQRIVDGQNAECLVVISAVGPRPDKPNWTASSIKLWTKIDALGWRKLEAEVVRDEDSGVIWDIAVFKVTPDPGH
ncbi:MAG: class I SAM-dependent methyltransferase [Rhizobiaceae bacterium]